MYTIYTLFYNTLVYHILCNAITIGVILNRFPNLGNITPVNSMQQYLMKQNSPKASRVLVRRVREKRNGNGGVFIFRCNVLINSFTKSYV